MKIVDIKMEATEEYTECSRSGWMMLDVEKYGGELMLEERKRI